WEREETYSLSPLRSCNNALQTLPGGPVQGAGDAAGGRVAGEAKVRVGILFAAFTRGQLVVAEPEQRLHLVQLGDEQSAVPGCEQVGLLFARAGVGTAAIPAATPVAQLGNPERAPI